MLHSVWAVLLLFSSSVLGTTETETENLGYASPIIGVDLGHGIVAPTPRRRLKSSKNCAPKCFELHGVASGDPTDTNVIIWTRLNLKSNPKNPRSCSRCQNPQVYFKVFDDTTVYKESFVQTSSAIDFTVKVDVGGLPCGKKLKYAFSLEEFPKTASSSSSSSSSETGSSNVLFKEGKTMTLPAPNTPASEIDIRFAQVSCQTIDGGYYLVYRDIAADDSIDFVLHLGDSIYEYNNTGGFFPSQFPWPNGTIPADRLAQPDRNLYSLEDYRTRHRQYKSDEFSQMAFAKKPFYFVWDDHEVADGAYSNGAVNHDETILSWTERKRNGIQAFYEWSAVRRVNTADMFDQFRVIRLGQLLDINLLDMRLSGRTQPKNSFVESLAAPAQTHHAIPATKLDNLISSIENSNAQWKAIGTSLSITDGSPAFFSPEFWIGIRDYWLGYYQQRALLLARLKNVSATNNMFLSGDIHFHQLNRIVDTYDYQGYFAERQQTPANIPLFNAGQRYAGDIVGMEVTTAGISSPDIGATLPPAVLAGLRGLFAAEFSYITTYVGITRRGFVVNHVRDGRWTTVQYGYDSVGVLTTVKAVDNKACWNSGSFDFLADTECEP